jgi:hypothetical protein
MSTTATKHKSSELVLLVFPKFQWPRILRISSYSSSIKNFTKFVVTIGCGMCAAFAQCQLLLKVDGHEPNERYLPSFLRYQAQPMLLTILEPHIHWYIHPKKFCCVLNMLRNSELRHQEEQYKSLSYCNFLLERTNHGAGGLWQHPSTKKSRNQDLDSRDQILPSCCHDNGRSRSQTLL